MNTTLKTLALAAFVGITSLASAALIPSTGKVKISDTPFDGGIYGGEFEAEISGFDAFYTFCVEKTEHLILPTATYDYELSDRSDKTGNVLSKGSAYLYETYIHGGLFDRTLDAAHDLAAGQLQSAIWFLEGQSHGGSALVAGNPFLALVASIFLGTETDDYTGNKVKVMNLTTKDSKGNVSYWQDQLVYVPDSGATLAILGLALTGLALARRRVR